MIRTCPTSHGPRPPYQRVVLIGLTSLLAACSSIELSQLMVAIAVMSGCVHPHCDAAVDLIRLPAVEKIPQAATRE